MLPKCLVFSDINIFIRKKKKKKDKVIENIKDSLKALNNQV